MPAQRKSYQSIFDREFKLDERTKEAFAKLVKRAKKQKHDPRYHTQDIACGSKEFRETANNLNKYMVTGKFSKKDPLEKKWWKEFAQELKKDIQKAQRKKTSSERISEITCTSEDIGKPIYSPLKKRSKK